jgi:hypothetical protein
VSFFASFGDHFILYFFTVHITDERNNSLQNTMFSRYSSQLNGCPADECTMLVYPHNGSPTLRKGDATKFPFLIVSSKCIDARPIPTGGAPWKDDFFMEEGVENDGFIAGNESDYDSDDSQNPYNPQIEEVDKEMDVARQCPENWEIRTIMAFHGGDDAPPNMHFPGLYGDLYVFTVCQNGETSDELYLDIVESEIPIMEKQVKTAARIHFDPTSKLLNEAFSLAFSRHQPQAVLECIQHALHNGWIISPEGYREGIVYATSHDGFQSTMCAISKISTM